MARFDKKWWFIHVPATVVVAGLIAFGVTKCNRLENLKQQTTGSVENMANASEKLNQAAAKIDSLLVVDKAKSDTIRHLKGVVEKRNDSIVCLNRSLSTVKTQLKECEKNANSLQQQVRNFSESNARPVAVERFEADTVRQVVVQTVDTCSNGITAVRLSAGTIFVIGRNNDTVILEDSVVNGANIFVGDNNVVYINGSNFARVNDTIREVDTVRMVDTVPAAGVRGPVTCSFRIVTVYGNTNTR